MSIYVKADKPAELIKEINELIEKKTIATWSVDSDGDYTHTASQWEKNAWIHPIVEETRVVFAIWGRKDQNLSIVDYAVFHGRFVEMLLNHFDRLCRSIDVTPLASSYDHIKATITANNQETK